MVGRWFVWVVGWSGRYFSWLAFVQRWSTSEASDDLRQSLVFCGLEVEPGDVVVCGYVLALVSFVVCLIGVLGLVVFCHGFGLLLVVVCGVCVVGVPVVVVNVVVWYPRRLALGVRLRSFGDVPEVLSYVVMSLKLVPNLEAAVRFAASESRTVLAGELRKVLWDVELRVFHGVDEGLAAFALCWGRWHEYVGRSVQLVRSSVCERDEVSRGVTLDRALDVSLEGTKEAMTGFVNRLQQPAMMVYSFGIMIPLALVAMVPAAGVVGLRVSVVEVCVVYDVVIPLVVLVLVSQILLMRPAVFSPPKIPSDHPGVVGVSRCREAVIACVFGGGLLVPFVLSVCPGSWSVVLRWLGEFIPFGLWVVWSVAVGVSWYCVRVFGPYRRVREEMKVLEREFGDALYVLGRRLAEDRSPEDSIVFTAKAVAGSRIAEVFVQTGYVQRSMHVSVGDAFFNPQFGSLRFVASDRIRSVTRLLVEGLVKSQQAVSVSIVRVADYLRALQEVEDRIKGMLNELVSTLRATAAVFAPLIAGVTLSITFLVSSILGSVGATVSSLPEATGGVLSVSGFSGGVSVAPEWFVVVIGVYVVELVVLLSRLTTGVTEGDDRAVFMYTVGRTMVGSVVVFSGTLVVGSWFFRSLVPTV